VPSEDMMAGAGAAALMPGGSVHSWSIRPIPPSAP
jgi:hypothetical protein